jgi:hypothetical protein
VEQKRNARPSTMSSRRGNEDDDPSAGSSPRTWQLATWHPVQTAHAGTRPPPLRANSGSGGLWVWETVTHGHGVWEGLFVARGTTFCRPRPARASAPRATRHAAELGGRKAAPALARAQRRRAGRQIRVERIIRNGLAFCTAPCRYAVRRALHRPSNRSLQHHQQASERAFH